VPWTLKMKTHDYMWRIVHKRLSCFLEWGLEYRSWLVQVRAYCNEKTKLYISSYWIRLCCCFWMYNLLINMLVVFVFLLIGCMFEILFIAEFKVKENRNLKRLIEVELVWFRHGAIGELHKFWILKIIGNCIIFLNKHTIIANFLCN